MKREYPSLSDILASSHIFFSFLLPLSYATICLVDGFQAIDANPRLDWPNEDAGMHRPQICPDTTKKAMSNSKMVKEHSDSMV